MARTSVAVFAIGLFAVVPLGCAGEVADTADAASNDAATADGSRSGAALDDSSTDAFLDASVPTACAAAGGRCIARDAICWGYSVGADCANASAACCRVVFDAGDCTDANAKTIQASHYEQSCTVDRDCVVVSEGSSCIPCDFSCGNAAINASAMAQYTSDTANLPAVLAVAQGACQSSCGGPVGVCCLGGMCYRGPPCPFESPVFEGSTDASADACEGCADAAGSCAGHAPSCLGYDSTMCCNEDPGPDAICANGTWMCGQEPAPGCNGIYCHTGSPVDAGGGG